MSLDPNAMYNDILVFHVHYAVMKCVWYDVLVHDVAVRGGDERSLRGRRPAGRARRHAV